MRSRQYKELSRWRSPLQSGEYDVVGRSRVTFHWMIFASASRRVDATFHYAHIHILHAKLPNVPNKKYAGKPQGRAFPTDESVRSHCSY